MQLSDTSLSFPKSKCPDMHLQHLQLILNFHVPENSWKLGKPGVFLKMYSVLKKKHLFFCKIYSMKYANYSRENIFISVVMNVRKTDGKIAHLVRNLLKKKIWVTKMVCKIILPIALFLI